MRPSEQILEVWFGEPLDDWSVRPELAKRWFIKDPAFDQELKDRFGAWNARAIAGEFDEWCESPRGCLALVILLDQFTRQIHRGSPLAWSADTRALELAERAVARGDDQKVRPIERVFFYLPFEHAESRIAQERSVELFKRLLDETPEQHRPMYQEFYDYAVAHKVIIDRFGHFPHRSEILGRPLTEEEREFLKQPNSSF